MSKEIYTESTPESISVFTSRISKIHVGFHSRNFRPDMLSSIVAFALWSMVVGLPTITKPPRGVKRLCLAFDLRSMVVDPPTMVQHLKSKAKHNRFSTPGVLVNDGQADHKPNPQED